MADYEGNLKFYKYKSGSNRNDLQTNEQTIYFQFKYAILLKI